MATILQTTFPNTSSRIDMTKFWIQIYWTVLMRIQLIIDRRCHYLNQCWPDEWRHMALLGHNQFNPTWGRFQVEFSHSDFTEVVVVVVLFCFVLFCFVLFCFVLPLLRLTINHPLSRQWLGAANNNETVRWRIHATTLNSTCWHIESETKWPPFFSDDIFRRIFLRWKYWSFD